ncbi:HLH domain-containing protein [Trichostrongylus colubriformis]|uniref:HLH domain-containing protein n=1 Tax=Trichostrongylus colubriformis TaxID=6319 RepID=A0AAN8J2C5_TRICO
MTSLSARQRNPLIRNKSGERSASKGATMIEAIKLKLHSDRGEQPGGAGAPLLSALDGYTEDELSEYRQVFNMFDTDRSGAIALDELETAIRNLGLEQTRDELDKIIDEVDQRGNHQIDFDEFCVVMRRLYMKKRSWNEVVKECFSVFDRYILRELGDITDNQIIDEIFMEADVDGNGLIDYDEFSYMVKNYMTDDDIN